jgi:hypothetical protein
LASDAAQMWARSLSDGPLDLSTVAEIVRVEPDLVVFRRIVVAAPVCDAARLAVQVVEVALGAVGLVLAWLLLDLDRV